MCIKSALKIFHSKVIYMRTFFLEEYTCILCSPLKTFHSRIIYTSSLFSFFFKIIRYLKEKKCMLFYLLCKEKNKAQIMHTKNADTMEIVKENCKISCICMCVYLFIIIIFCDIDIFKFSFYHIFYNLSFLMITLEKFPKAATIRRNLKCMRNECERMDHRVILSRSI